MIIIWAAEGDEFASWDEDAKHGLFTKHLLEALNGTADKHAKTGNKNGTVTLVEVKAYLDRKSTYQARRWFSRDQHPTVSGDLKTVLSAYWDDGGFWSQKSTKLFRGMGTDGVRSPSDTAAYSHFS